VNTITFDLDIYTFHVDFSGFVGPIAYAQWIEIAWLKLLEAIALPRHQMTNEDLQPILTTTAVEYHQPLYLGDRVRVEIWITRLAATEVDLRIRFYNAAQRTVAEAQQSWTFTDSQQARPKNLGPEITLRFQPYLRSAVD
jgi:acyl-CoA thioester hydrolase